MNLSAIKKLDLLKKLYKEILIPYAVWDEVVEKGKGQPGAEDVNQRGRSAKAEKIAGKKFTKLEDLQREYRQLL
jgi:predicted nucleic acid-binding protein